MSDTTEKHNSFWLDSICGKELFNTELKQISSYLNSIFGFHILQVGCPEIDYLLNNSRINHKVVLSQNYHKNLNASADTHQTKSSSILYAKNDYIPLGTDSIDAVVVAHELEFSKDPHALLREIDRILLPDGHLIILCLNPWSLWGLRSYMTHYDYNKPNSQYPWHGKWLGAHRIIDWLNLLNYQIEQKSYYFFRPCINNEKLLNSMRFVEQIGKILPLGAAGFCICAKKCQEALTPLKAKWQDNIELAGEQLY